MTNEKFKKMLVSNISDTSDTDRMMIWDLVKGLNDSTLISLVRISIIESARRLNVWSTTPKPSAEVMRCACKNIINLIEESLDK